MTKRRGNLAIGGLVMAGLGYVLGLLTAPKSGKETRKDIQETAAKAKTEAEKKLKAAHAELGDLVEQGTTRLKSLSFKARSELSKTLANAKNAKDKAKNVLSAIHEGESDDKELEKAIKEATRAVDHLKQYLSKNTTAK